MLSLPTFAFIVVTLVGWSLLAMALKPRLGAIPYAPMLGFFIQASTLGEFADALLQNPATVALPLVLIAGGVAALPAIWGMAPVLWTELRAPEPRDARDAAYTARLGRWLTHAIAGLKLSGIVMYSAMTFALPFGALVALLQTLKYLPPDLWGAALPHIQTLGMATGVAFAWLFAIRGRLKQLALGFRPGLDILLDVDNWMRELPADDEPEGADFGPLRVAAPLHGRASVRCARDRRAQPGHRDHGRPAPLSSRQCGRRSAACRARRVAGVFLDDGLSAARSVCLEVPASLSLGRGSPIPRRSASGSGPTRTAAAITSADRCGRTRTRTTRLGPSSALAPARTRTIGTGPLR